VLFIAAFVPYIRAILRKETQPAKASWIIWASLDTITFAGMLAKHSVNGQIVGAICGAWTVVVLALKYGKSGWTLLDKLCLGGAVLGIVLWQAFSNPVLGIVTSLSVVFVGSFPTFASAWHDPSKEDRTAWTIFFISCVVAMFAIPAATLADAAQPSTFFLIETIMVSILYLRPRMLARTA
jgi:cation transport ATPase